MPIRIELPSGRSIMLDQGSVTLGTAPDCDVVLPSDKGLHARHATIRRVTNRWIIEAEGDWCLQVGSGVPGRKCWLGSGNLVRLSERGYRISFHLVEHYPTEAPKDSSHSAPTPTSLSSAATAAIGQPLLQKSSESIEEWYFAVGDNRRGPVNGEQLKSLVASGELRTTDLVWREGLTDWQTVESLKALSPVRSAADVPPAHPPSVQRQPTPNTVNAARAKEAEMGQPGWKERLWNAVTSHQKAGTSAATIAAISYKRFLGRKPVLVGAALVGILAFVVVVLTTLETDTTPIESPSDQHTHSSSPDSPSAERRVGSPGEGVHSAAVVSVADPVAVIRLSYDSGLEPAAYGAASTDFSKDGRYLVINGCKLWSVDERREVPLESEEEREEGGETHRYTPGLLSISPDGRTLAGILGEVRLYSLVHTPITRKSAIRSQYPETKMVLWSPTSEYLVLVYKLGCQVVPVCSASADGPMLYGVRGKREEQYIPVSFSDPPIISPDGRFLAVKFVGEEDNPFVKVFALKTGSTLGILPFSRGGESECWMGGFSADSSRFLSFVCKEEVVVWRTSDWTSLRSIRGSFCGVLPNRQEFAMYPESLQEPFQAWSLDTVETTRTLPPSKGLIERDDDGRSAGANGGISLVRVADQRIEVWQGYTDRLVAVLDSEKGDPRCGVAVSDDGRFVALGRTDNSLEVWDLTTGNRSGMGGYLATRRERQDKFPDYMEQVAPPVTRALFDQVQEGWNPQDVWELFGGKPVKTDGSVSRNDVMIGGSVFEGIDLKFADVEEYQGNGGPRSKVILVYYGDTVPAPLVRKWQVGLK